MEEFRIYFYDLNKETQKELLEFFEVNKPEQMNWDTMPIIVFTNEED